MDAVAAVAPHHREAAGLSVLLDDVAQLSVADAGLHCGSGGRRQRRSTEGVRVNMAARGPLTGVDGLHKAFVRGLDQFLCFFVHVAHEEGLVQVAVETVVENRDVDCRKTRRIIQTEVDV